MDYKVGRKYSGPYYHYSRLGIGLPPRENRSQRLKVKGKYVAHPTVKPDISHLPGDRMPRVAIPASGASQALGRNPPGGCSSAAAAGAGTTSPPMLSQCVVHCVHRSIFMPNGISTQQDSDVSSVPLPESLGVP